jgi:hypothetical protein
MFQFITGQRYAIRKNRWTENREKNERHANISMKKGYRSQYSSYRVGIERSVTFKNTMQMQKLDSLIWIEFNEVSETWINEWKYEYSYDDNRNLIEEIEYWWYETFNEWINNWKWEYSYDVNDNIIEEIEYVWNETLTSWDPDYKYGYFYNGGGNMSEVIYYYWDGVSTWINDWKYEYFHDANENIAEEIEYRWDESSTSWIQDYKYEYTYDNSLNVNNLILPFFEAWFINSYYKNGKLLTILETDWDSNSSVWYNAYRADYYYSDFSITSLSDHTKEFNGKIFPNPVNNILNVRINLNKEVDFSIFDNTGEKVLSGKLFDSVMEIDISHLHYGLYILELKSDTQIVFSKKFIKQ